MYSEIIGQIKKLIIFLVKQFTKTEDHTRSKIKNTL